MSESQNVAGAADNTLNHFINKQDPVDESYFGGAITNMYRLDAYYPYRAELDPSYKHIAFVDVPTGSNVSTLFSAYYNKKTTGFDTHYDRYYRELNSTVTSTSLGGDYAYINASGVGVNYNQLNTMVTPDSIVDGVPFFIRAGVDYRQKNGQAQNTTINLYEYIRGDRPEWQIRPSAYHSTGVTNKTICGLADNSICNVGMSAQSASSFANPFATQNSGTDIIKDTRLELYQPTTGSARVNFNTVYLRVARDASFPDSLPDWPAFQVAYVIVDTNGTTNTILHTSKTVYNNFSAARDNLLGEQFYKPNSTDAENSVALSLPVLKPTEYIDKIILTPMGTDGSNEGAWLGQTCFGLFYTVKAWQNETWPDGERMGPWNYVDMQYTLYYFNKTSSLPSTFPEKGGVSSGNNGVYYTDAPYALAALTSTDASGRLPNTTVDYNIYGSNNALYSAEGKGDWENPLIMIRVPDFLTLLDSLGNPVLNTAVFVCNDLVTKPSYDVDAKFLGSRAGYNYYSFQINGYTVHRHYSGYSPLFSIPVTFRIAPTAEPGTYPLRVLVSSEHKENFVMGYTQYPYMNIVPAGSYASDFKLDVVTDNFFDCGRLTTMPSTSLTIVSSASIGATTTVASSFTEYLFVESKVIPAKDNEDVYVRLLLTNRGSTPVTDIRLYDILPYANDKLNSSGQITFVSINATASASATVKYTKETAGTTNVPFYGLHLPPGGSDPNIQDLVFATVGWSDWNNSVTDKVTAVFIDFGNFSLGASEQITVTLTFHIPLGESQTAYNQFRYSVREQDGRVLRSNSLMAGFSTKAIVIAYIGNRPTVTPTIGDVSNLPENTSAIIGYYPAIVGPNIGVNDTLKVNSSAPLLTGYTFAGWNTEPDGTGKWWGIAPFGEYSEGDSVSFASAGTLILYANWTRNTLNILYDLNASVTSSFTPALGSDTALFGGLVGSTFADESGYVEQTNPVSATHNFAGWYENATWANDPLNANYTRWTFSADTVTDSGYTKTFYAGWVPKTGFSVTYYGNGNDGGDAVIDPNSYSFGDPVTVLGNTWTKTDYVPVGWNTKADGSGTSYAAGAKFPMPADNVELYAQWSDVVNPPDDYTVQYVSFGHTSGVVPVDSNVYGSGESVVVFANPGGLVRIGYSFVGWAYSSAATSADFVVTGTSVLPSSFVIYGDVVLFAVWSAVDYTVVYDPGAHGTFNVTIHSGLHYGDVTPAAPTVTGEAGWNFTGWAPVRAATVTASVTYVAQWAQTSTPSPSPSPSPSTSTRTPPPSPTVSTSPTPPPTSSSRPPFEPESEGSWAVVNLGLSILGVVLAVVAVVFVLLSKKKGEQKVASGGGQRVMRSDVLWLVIGVVVGVLGVVVFLLTEDTGIAMGWVDKWTVVNAVLFVVGVISSVLVFKAVKQQAKSVVATEATKG